MHSSLSLLLAVAAAFAVVVVVAGDDGAAGGWPADVAWVSHADALADTSKPTLVLFWASYCGACKSLKRALADDSAAFVELSSRFSMVHHQSDGGAKPAWADDAAFAPDGGYIPRVLFIDAAGSVSKFSPAGANPKYKYFYHSASMLVDGMKAFLAEHAKDEL